MQATHLSRFELKVWEKEVGPQLAGLSRRDTTNLWTFSPMRCLGKPFLGPTNIWVSICLALLLGGCAEFTVINVDGTEKVPDKVPQDPAEVVDPPQSNCRGLHITKPLQNDVIATPSF